jgi:hypothetical protein
MAVHPTEFVRHEITILADALLWIFVTVSGGLKSDPHTLASFGRDQFDHEADDVTRSAMFALDINGNGVWCPGVDKFGFFGATGDVPIVCLSGIHLDGERPNHGCGSANTPRGVKLPPQAEGHAQMGRQNTMTCSLSRCITSGMREMHMISSATKCHISLMFS